MLSCPTCDSDDLDKGTLTFSLLNVPVGCVACGYEWLRRLRGPAVDLRRPRAAYWALGVEVGVFLPWRRDPSALPPNDLSKLNQPDAAQMRSMQRPAGSPRLPRVLGHAQVLVTEHVPRYTNRDPQLWTITALPSRNRGFHHRRLFTLAFSNVEVRLADYDPKTGEDLCGALHVCSSPRTRGPSGDSNSGTDRYFKSSVRPTHTSRINRQAWSSEISTRHGHCSNFRRFREDLREGNLISIAQVPSVFPRFHTAAFVEQSLAGAESG